MKERKLFKLFFDGALKGNPGVAGGGGVMINPEGNNELEYYWNIELTQTTWLKLMVSRKDLSSWKLWGLMKLLW